jgi:hypothetical protein
LADLYPHQLVTSTKSVEDAYAAIGLIVPVDAMFLDGTRVDSLPAGSSFEIGEDSVLVPQADSPGCLSGMVDGEIVFDRSNCPFNVIVDSDGGPNAVAGWDTLANTIATTEIPFSYLPGFGDGGGSDAQVTAFGEASISHHWFSELSSRASYVRSDSGATSLGSSTVSDHALLETTWTPTRRLDLQVRGDWLRRKSATDTSNTFVEIEDTNFGGPTDVDVAINTGGLVSDTFHSTVDTEYWRVSGRAAYRTSRRSSVSLRASYQYQDTDRGSSRGHSSFKNVLVILGFRYDFDPFHF